MTATPSLDARRPRPRRVHPTPLPRARGPISQALLTLLAGPPTRDPGILAASHVTELWQVEDDVPWWRAGDDAALALVHLAELDRRGLEGVPNGWEGHPLLASARWSLATPLRYGLERLRESVELPPRVTGLGVARVVVAMVAGAAEGSAATRDGLVTTAVQRLRERDARAVLLPRLAGTPRRLLACTLAGDPAEIDGVPGAGAGDTERDGIGAVLRHLGLSDRTGEHLDRLPGPALWRLALLDHLVAHRATRGVAMGWLTAADGLAASGRFATGDALRGLGLDAAERQAWDGCVVGRLTTLVATESLVDAEPGLAADVLLGARACVTATTAVEHDLAAWSTSAAHDPHDTPEVDEAPGETTEVPTTEGLT
ncbi:MAG TPA: hypothetical protein VKY71_04140 [Actinotalea caeni]|uniref:hypothetical protein n=1 Tax=Actinotalea caeni TaxID=1348467 RepID=UPI002B4AF351|nr:hypothetical protein [Actinotalea caeni]HLV54745.1 hypothetical protein [Actinotalea caeni]